MVAIMQSYRELPFRLCFRCPEFQESPLTSLCFACRRLQFTAPAALCLRVEGLSDGIASPYPQWLQVCAMPSALGFAVRRRAVASWPACAGAPCGHWFRIAPIPLHPSSFRFGSALSQVSHSLRRRHAMSNRAAAGAEVVNVPHRLGTHKQGVAEWCWSVG